MAHYGIQAAVTAKTASKRSPNVEQALLTWVFENIDEKVPEGVSYEETLKDGVVLCKLMNKIKQMIFVYTDIHTQRTRTTIEIYILFHCFIQFYDYRLVRYSP